MDKTIKPEERLYRAVLPSILWDDEEGRFSTALFKDKNGASVDRQGNRNEATICSDFRNKFKGKDLKGVVYVYAEFCNELPSYLVYKPLEDDDYHSEIHDSENKKLLSKSKLKKLAQNCKMV